MSIKIPATIVKAEFDAVTQAFAHLNGRNGHKEQLLSLSPLGCSTRLCPCIVLFAPPARAEAGLDHQRFHLLPFHASEKKRMTTGQVNKVNIDEVRAREKKRKRERERACQICLLQGYL